MDLRPVCEVSDDPVTPFPEDDELVGRQLRILDHNMVCGRGTDRDRLFGEPKLGDGSVRSFNGELKFHCAPFGIPDVWIFAL